MISVKVVKENKKYKKVTILGHALYDDYGKDIVCAGVSALVLNTINSIEEFTEDKFSCAQEEKSGLVEFVIVSEVSKEASLLMDSLFLGLMNIQHDYGKRFITVKA